MHNIETVWKNIVLCAGQTFFTITGIEYTYHIAENRVCLENTNRNIPKKDFEKALGVANPTVVAFQKMNLQGPSYLLGIITDPRIRA